MRFSITMGV